MPQTNVMEKAQAQSQRVPENLPVSKAVLPQTRKTQIGGKFQAQKSKGVNRIIVLLNGPGLRMFLVSHAILAEAQIMVELTITLTLKVFKQAVAQGFLKVAQ